MKKFGVAQNKDVYHFSELQSSRLASSQIESQLTYVLLPNLELLLTKLTLQRKAAGSHSSTEPTCSICEIANPGGKRSSLQTYFQCWHTQTAEWHEDEDQGF